MLLESMLHPLTASEEEKEGRRKGKGSKGRLRKLEGGEEKRGEERRREERLERGRHVRDRR
jgi:hypothetical protein